MVRLCISVALYVLTRHRVYLLIRLCCENSHAKISDNAVQVTGTRSYLLLLRRRRFDRIIGTSAVQGRLGGCSRHAALYVSKSLTRVCGAVKSPQKLMHCIKVAPNRP